MGLYETRHVDTLLRMASEYLRHAKANLAPGSRCPAHASLMRLGPLDDKPERTLERGSRPPSFLPRLLLPPPPPRKNNLPPCMDRLEPHVVLLPLVWTSPESWLEKEFVPGVEPEFDEDMDKKGSLALGVTLTISGLDGTDESKETRLVVMGDSDFASNRHFRNGNNSDLFLTSVNWLAAGEDIISVDRKVLPLRQLILDPEEARFLHFSSIGLLPLLLLLTGGYLWWRRR